MNQYRPDIDGLRAISVLLVLFFHANIFGISSGFIGVDIFFVISGYLITSGIQNNLEKNKFSFVEFFKRRLWRLQPVFIALLLVTALMTTATYLPDDYLRYTESAQFATQLRANQYFSGLETGYFAQDSGLMPLLHTWSLSIEWQWYLLLPFLMFFFYTVKIKKIIYWAIPLLIIAIIIPFYFIEDRNSSAYYYSFSARIFEMLIGSFLAGVGSKGLDKIPTHIRSFVGLICLAVIGYIAFSNQVISLYPNWYAVAICVSAALLIYIGQEKNLVSKLLSFKPLVFIGVLSYSIYIWHWPVFAFVRNLGLKETALVTTLSLFLSFVFACISYYLIENKFRRYYTVSTLKTLLFLAIIPACLMYALNEINKRNEGFGNRFSNYQLIDGIDAEYRDISELKAKCILKRENPIPTTCFFGAAQSDKKALLIGDSYSNHSVPFVDKLAKDENISIHTSAFSAHLVLQDIYLNSAAVYPSLRDDAIKKDFDDIKNQKYEYVIISHAWSNYNYYQYPNIKLESNIDLKDTQEIIKIAVDNTLKTITESGAKPIIIREIQQASKYNNHYKHYSDARLCFLNKYKMPLLNSWINEGCDFELTKKWDKQQLFYDDLWNEMQKKYPTITIIDMTELQCKDGTCHSDINGYPLYSDSGAHLTDYASYQFAVEYLSEHENPFK